ncbi:helix-turn-helix domain-containing protein [Algicola sagamiensis]|uniref:hypothetical protein n=1 Tax=Algicola sagamiensis TaxID=163869 RepID=UPI0012FB591C|nr:hypothetical protein [Algicola sagamiensis]
MSTLLQEFAGQKNRLSIHRVIIKITGSHARGFVLDQLMFWQSKTKRPDGWFYKTHAELAEECCMSQNSARYAIDQLVELGFVESKTRKANGTPTKHYRVLYEAIEQAIYALSPDITGNGKSPESDMGKVTNGNGNSPKSLEVGKVTNGYEEIPIPLELGKFPYPVTYSNIHDHTDQISVPKPKDPEPEPEKPKKRQTKPDAFKAMFAAYPKHRKGGTDATAWKVWKSENLTEQDAQSALDWLSLAAQTDPDWGTDAGGCFVYGITKFIRERMWLTPTPQPRVNPQPLNQPVQDDNYTGWRHDLGY